MYFCDQFLDFSNMFRLYRAQNRIAKGSVAQPRPQAAA
jgi:hypothetical protein